MSKADDKTDKWITRGCVGVFLVVGVFCLFALTVKEITRQDIPDVTWYCSATDGVALEYREFWYNSKNDYRKMTIAEFIQHCEDK